MAGSRAGAASRLEMALLGLGTGMDIKDIGIKMAVGILLLTVGIEMVYRHLHHWKSEDLLGDGTIAPIPDYRQDLRRQ